MNDTIAAISSAGGPIGLIRVSGPRAIEAVDAVFKIEYVDEAGGEYKSAFYFAVNKSRL